MKWGKRLYSFLYDFEDLILAQREIHPVLAFRAPEPQWGNVDVRMLGMAGERDDRSMSCSG